MQQSLWWHMTECTHTASQAKLACTEVCFELSYPSSGAAQQQRQRNCRCCCCRCCWCHGSDRPAQAPPLPQCTPKQHSPIPTGSCARALRIGRVSFSFVDPESVNSPDRILELISSSPAACFVLSLSGTAATVKTLLLARWGLDTTQLGALAVTTAPLLLRPGRARSCCWSCILRECANCCTRKVNFEG